MSHPHVFDARLPVLAVFLGLILCLIASAGCAPDRDPSQPPTPSDAEQEEPADAVVLEASLSADTFVTRSEQVANVTLENATDTTQTVADILGIRIKDGAGEIVFDSVPEQPAYPAVMIDLGPGESRDLEVPFDVPPPGKYRLEGYLWDDTTSPAVEFTSLPS